MLDQQADETLALAAATGDRDAFGQLLERHYDRIYRLGWRLLGHGPAAEDLAQEIAMALPRKLRSFKGEARFSTWLYRVVVNAARDAIRAQARQARLAEDFSDVNALRQAGDTARAAEIEWLHNALQALKPDLRETAALVLGDEMTHRQAAQVLGVKESTISWRLSEIRKMLKQMSETEQGSIR